VVEGSVGALHHGAFLTIRVPVVGGVQCRERQADQPAIEVNAPNGAFSPRSGNVAGSANKRVVVFDLTRPRVGVWGVVIVVEEGRNRSLNTGVDRVN